jgi:hypothetical protein
MVEGLARRHLFDVHPDLLREKFRQLLPNLVLTSESPGQIFGVIAFVYDDVFVLSVPDFDSYGQDLLGLIR